MTKKEYDIKDYLDAKFTAVDNQFTALCVKIESMKSDTDNKFSDCKTDCDLKIQNRSLKDRLWIIIPSFLAVCALAVFLYSTYVLIPLKEHITEAQKN